MKKYILIITGLILLTGCAKTNDSVNTYKANMDQFFENIKEIDSSINSLTPDPTNEADSSKRMLLDYLDILETTFSQMASLELPEGYEALGELATQSSEDMTQAVSLFHSAYDNGYDPSYESVAYEYYIKSNKELKTIVKALHGDYNPDNNEENTSEEYESILIRNNDEDDYSIYLEDEYEDYYEAYGEDNPNAEVTEETVEE